MKKAYLSGPITGDKDYRRKFENCAIRLREILGYDNDAEIINPALIGDIIPSGAKYDEIMEICFKIIEMCDAVVMLPGWENSKGANQEYGFAKALGKEIFIWEDLV